VAYRYFATAKRKFIIADTPGHEQYTRNMVTGASTAHAAIILVDATRVTIENGVAQLLPQTKRHSAIVKLLALQHVIVAINKMDLVDYSEARFNEIRDAYVALAQQLGLTDVRFVPVSALKGDNIVGASERMPWYAGEPLLDVLESLPVETQARRAALPGAVGRAPGRQLGRRFPRLHGPDRIGRGEGRRRDRVLPSNRTATIAEIIAPVPGGTAAVPHAFAGQTVTIRLAKTSTCRAATCS
jgi:sulfate adenylyltransferase subunit 1